MSVAASTAGVIRLTPSTPLPRTQAFDLLCTRLGVDENIQTKAWKLWDDVARFLCPDELYDDILPLCHASVLYVTQLSLSHDKQTVVRRAFTLNKLLETLEVGPFKFYSFLAKFSAKVKQDNALISNLRKDNIATVQSNNAFRLGYDHAYYILQELDSTILMKKHLSCLIHEMVSSPQESNSAVESSSSQANHKLRESLLQYALLLLYYAKATLASDFRTAYVLMACIAEHCSGLVYGISNGAESVANLKSICSKLLTNCIAGTRYVDAPRSTFRSFGHELDFYNCALVAREGIFRRFIDDLYFRGVLNVRKANDQAVGSQLIHNIRSLSIAHEGIIQTKGIFDERLIEEGLFPDNKDKTCFDSTIIPPTLLESYSTVFTPPIQQSLLRYLKHAKTQMIDAVQSYTNTLEVCVGFETSCRLYWQNLHLLLDQETKIGNGHIVDLVQDTKFHTSLIACSLELGFAEQDLCEGKDRLEWILNALVVCPFEVQKIIEVLIRASKAGPAMQLAHLARCERELISKHVWNSKSSLWKEGSLSLLELCKLGQLPGIEIFYRKVQLTASSTLESLCQSLNVPESVAEKSSMMIMHAVSIDTVSFMKNRHLDQIVMGSLYLANQLHASKETNCTSLDFNTIVDAYKHLDHAKPQTCYEVDVSSGRRADICQFYNEVFLNLMQPFLNGIADVLKPEKLLSNSSAKPTERVSALNHKRLRVSNMSKSRQTTSSHRGDRLFRCFLPFRLENSVRHLSVGPGNGKHPMSHGSVDDAFRKLNDAVWSNIHQR